MSVQEDVNNIINDSGVIEQTEESVSVFNVNQATIEALLEVSTFLSATSGSLETACARVEAATERASLRKSLRYFNECMAMLKEASPADAEEHVILGAFEALPLSTQFKSLLPRHPNLAEVIAAYKSLVIRNMTGLMRRNQERLRQSEEQDDELFNQWLPNVTVDVKVSEPAAEVSPPDGTNLTGKRGAAAILDQSFGQPIPKKLKSSIPALASLNKIVSIDTQGGSEKKVLMTRERLRKGINDPKGLLDLGGSSTNALERAKRLELLKSAGVDYSSQKGSFSEKLNSASLRLDLGLVGHTMSDTRLFGAKVLSTPRRLTPTNISNIENNVFDGKTTWKHQNSYATAMIAGCINQAKRVIGMYDEVLFGPSPESMIDSTHRAIVKMLASSEGKAFMDDISGGKGVSSSESNEFIKKIIGTIPPVIPLTLRNEALDGGLLRTALLFLGAAEILFSQYEVDIRANANPAGLVGMCSAMHAEFEHCTLFNKELRGLRDFTKEMKSQYQTSLGLGSSFPNDSVARKAAKRKTNSGQSFSFRRGQFIRPGMGRGQQEVAAVSDRGRNPCYAFRAGTCGRGTACRFDHVT